MIIIYVLIATLLFVPLGLVGLAFGLSLIEAVVLAVMANVTTILGAAATFGMSGDKAAKAGKAETPLVPDPSTSLPDPRPRLTLVPTSPQSSGIQRTRASRRRSVRFVRLHGGWPAHLPADLHLRLRDALSYRSVSPDDLWDEMSDWLETIGAPCPLEPAPRPQESSASASPLASND